MALVRVMANTPHSSWAGCPYFDLRELLEQSNARPEKLQVALDEMNRALDDLGITSFRVESITRDSLAADEVGQWTVKLISTSDPTKTYSFQSSAQT